MGKEYNTFVENLRQLLMEQLGLNEKQIFFRKKNEHEMTKGGDRLFVECHAPWLGKKFVAFILRNYLKIIKMVCL